MDERVVHIVGTGSVGLAYGYLLSARGHKVFHTSLRGNRLARIPVRIQTPSGTVSSTYAPRYHLAEDGSPAPDLGIFAVPETAFHQYVRRISETGGSPLAGQNVLFSSLFDPGECEQFASRYHLSLGLVFPLISCEYDEEDALRIATDLELEVLAPAAAGVLLGDLGFTVNAVGPERFRARYVQTAAAYVALRAHDLGLADGPVKAALVVDMLSELSAMAGLAGGKEGTGAMRAPIAQFASLCSLAAQRRRSSGEPVTVDNIRYLMGPGRRKLVSHLEPIEPLWISYLSSLPASQPSRTRDLISAVLATG